MLTKKIVPSFFLAFFVLSCSTSNVIFEKPKEIIFEDVKESSTSAKPSATSSPLISGSVSPSPSVSPSSGTSPNPSASVSTSPTPTPTPTPSVVLLKTKYVISGKVYDRVGSPISSADVFIFAPSYQSSAVKTDSNGYFLLSGVSPDLSSLFVVAKKSGYSTVPFEITNNNQSVDDRFVEFNGETALFAEPYTTLKINGVTFTEPGDDFNPPNEVTKLAVSNVNESGLTLSFTFSEFIDQPTVESSLELVSENTIPNDSSSSQVYNSSSGMFNFDWKELSDHAEMSLTFNSPLAKRTDASDTKYRLYFKGKFKDDDGTYSIAGKSIKFSSTRYEDYVIFSIKN